MKWAFTRLRPSPHSGSIDVAPGTATDSPAILVDVTEAAPALDSSISAEPFRATPADVELVVVEQVLFEQVLPVDVASEQVNAPEVVSNDSPVELLTSIEPVVVEEAPVSSVEIASEPADAPEAVISATEASCVACADDKVSDVSESSIDSDPSPSVALEIEPVLESPAPVLPRSPTARAKVTEPADRAALIRQRWAETGIRMWNPRLHGTGDATLNIQGRVGLLPPAPGETMPRYDKLEFGMLGGQIVCEGVVVEAHVQADKRSFTHLAAPGKPERVRERMRERQAALA